MNWKVVIRSLKNKDMQKRLGIVLGLIVAYRLLAHIPVPLAEPSKLKDIVQNVVSSSDFGGFLNIMTGGALAQLSIVLAGLSPFITASIITQLLTKAIPRLEEMHKDGETGRRKINVWTRIITVPLAIAQSAGIIYLLRQSVLAGSTASTVASSPNEWFVAITAMTAGSILLMWLGELMTEQGVGNGISLLIFAGIISQLPTTFGSIVTSLFDTQSGSLSVFGWFTVPVNPTMFYTVICLAAIGLVSLYLLVKINEAQRVITINYAKRVSGNTSYGGIKGLLPMRLISAGVVPIIFAMAFLSLPSFVGQIMRASNINPELGTNLVKWFQAPSATTYASGDASMFVYPVAYFLLIIAFTYFYSSFVFDTHEMSEGLENQGGFIEGVRPGSTTDEYLKRTVTRLNLFGSMVLGIISVMPFIIDYVAAQLGVNTSNLAIGGTSLLIVVTVGLETLRAINSRALMVTYDDFSVDDLDDDSIPKPKRQLLRRRKAVS